MAELRPRSGLVDPSSPSAEPFRVLRLALQLRANGAKTRTMLFTSAEIGEGKSTLAANYALVSSLTQGATLLVDGDLRRPTQHELFGITRAPGLVEALAAGGKVSAYAHPVRGLARLSVLPAGEAIGSVGDVVASGKMARLLERAADEYQLIVVDSPPLLHSADAAGFASQPGVEVVLVTDGASRRRTLQKAIKRLQPLDAHIAGIVVNRVGRLNAYGY